MFVLYYISITLPILSFSLLITILPNKYLIASLHMIKLSNFKLKYIVHGKVRITDEVFSEQNSVLHPPLYSIS